MTTRKILRSLNYEQFEAIARLILGIKDGLESMLETYKHYFSEQEIQDLTKKLIMVKNLIGEKLSNADKLPWSYLLEIFDDRQRISLFKQNARRIFQIEEECKKYTSRIWAGEITKVSEFDITKPFKLIVSAFRDDDVDEQLKHLREKKIKHLSTSLITNNFLGLFHNSYYGIVYEVNENNYLASYERDAESGYFKIGGNSTSSFEKKVNVGALKIEEDDFIGCNEPAVITKTPDFIEKMCINKWFIEKDSRYDYSEIVLDRRHSEPKGVFCIIFSNSLLSPAYRKAKKIANELNLPLICIDKDLLCKGDNLLELTLHDTFEIEDGMKMNLEHNKAEELHDLFFKTDMKNHFDNRINAYLKIFSIIKNQPNSCIIKGLHEEVDKKSVELKQRWAEMCSSNMSRDF